MLTSNGENLLVQSADGWHEYSLPQSFSLVERILIDDELCYVLSERRLTLVDLRSNRISVIAEGVDDAVLTTFTELWVLSDYELRRVTALGRELETRTLTELPTSIWMEAGSLLLMTDDSGTLVPDWLEELTSLDVFLPEMDNLVGRIGSATTADMAVDECYLYLLANPRTVLKIPRELR